MPACIWSVHFIGLEETDSTMTPLIAVFCAAQILLQDKETVEYGLIDQGAELRNTTVTLRLVWDHMPLTGRLCMESTPKDKYKLPGHYQ